MTELARIDALHPLTGELLDLTELPNWDLAELCIAGVTHAEHVKQFRQAVADEIARRCDRANTRQLMTGDVELEVNAPITEEWRPDELIEAIRPFVEAGELDPEVYAKLIAKPEPKRPPPRVDRRELGKLRRSASDALRAALDAIRVEVHQRRTVTVRRRGTV